MKICYIANSASSHTVKWVNYFLSLGNEVYVISHSRNEIPGATVYYIDYRIKNFFIKQRKVHSLIKQINPDILHAQQANTCGLYAVTMKGYKAIVSAWGSDVLVSPEKSFIMKLIVKHVLKKALFITSDSYYMTEKIIQLGGKKEIIYTFPMGVEDSLLKYIHKYDVNKPLVRFISNRRLEKMYNVDIIIKGFALALEENNNIELAIAADGLEMNNLIELSKSLNIQHKVSFTGLYNAEKIGDMLKNSDVFVSIPESDSTSVSLLESMCCGLFSIVSDLQANREWIEDGNNGLIVDNINEFSVRDSILWCVGNKQHMKNKSEYNTDLIIKRALWKNNAKIIEDIYKRATS
jgi:glycosyltransferase involved in cell wall biosynthesis